MTVQQLNGVQTEIRAQKRNEKLGYGATLALLVGTIALGVLGAHGMLDPVYAIMAGVGTVIVLGFGQRATKKRAKAETQEEQIIDSLRRVGIRMLTVKQQANAPVVQPAREVTIEVFSASSREPLLTAAERE